MSIEDQIKSYVSNPDKVLNVLALLKVGNESGDDADVIVQKLMMWLLLDFHAIPLKTGDN